MLSFEVAAVTGATRGIPPGRPHPVKTVVGLRRRTTPTKPLTVVAVGDAAGQS